MVDPEALLQCHRLLIYTHDDAANLTEYTSLPEKGVTTKTYIDALSLLRELKNTKISTINIVDKIFENSIELLPHMTQLKSNEKSSLAITCRGLTEIYK